MDDALTSVFARLMDTVLAPISGDAMDTDTQPIAGKNDDVEDTEFKDDAPMSETEFKLVSLEMVTDDLQPNEFKAYPAITGNVDQGGDYIPHGAFTSVLDQARQQARVYAQHGIRDSKLPIGRPTEVGEDGKGLFVRGRVSETAEGRDVLTLLRDGVIDSMSIGYKPKRVRYLSHAEGKSMFGEGEYKAILDRLPANRPRVRVLEEFKGLFDFSFVDHPMNLDAKVLGVKGDAPHAGVTLEDHFEAVHDAAEELLVRVQDVAEMRFKAGRMLSAANVTRLQSMREDHAALLQKLDDLLDAALPKDDESDGKSAEMAEVEMKVQTEHLRFLAQQARALGVPLT